jgi:hypothetical protein
MSIAERACRCLLILLNFLVVYTVSEEKSIARHIRSLINYCIFSLDGFKTLCLMFDGLNTVYFGVVLLILSLICHLWPFCIWILVTFSRSGKFSDIGFSY